MIALTDVSVLPPIVINGLVHENLNVNAFGDVRADVFDFTSYAPREKRPPAMPIKRGSMDKINSYSTVLSPEYLKLCY